MDQGGGVRRGLTCSRILDSWTEAIWRRVHDRFHVSLNSRSCRAIIDSMRSQPEEPGIMPRPPSGFEEVMKPCTRRIRSAGERGCESTLTVSEGRTTVGSPYKKSECLRGEDGY